ARPRTARPARAQLPELQRDSLGPFKPNVVERTRQQLLDRLPPFVAVVACVLVDVHVDEAVAPRGIHAAAEAERILERLLAVLERGVDRLAQDVRHLSDCLLAETAPPGVH